MTIMTQKTLFSDCAEIKEPLNEAKKTKRIIMMDGGERKNTVKVWDTATTTEYILTFDEYVDMFSQDSFQGVRYDEYDLVYFVSELAHWILQNEFSNAQIFPEEKMEKIIDAVSRNPRFVMAAWSEKMTTAALKMYKRPSDGLPGFKDVDDCAALANYIQSRNYYKNLKIIKSISDVKPIDPNSPIGIGDSYKANHWNKDMNKAQKVNYGLPKKQGIYQDLDLCKVMRDIILPNWEYFENNLPPELKKLWLVDADGYTWQDLDKKNKTLANYPDEHVHITEYRNLIRVIKRTKDSTKGLFKKGDVDIIDWIPQMRGIYAAFNGIFDFDGVLRKHPMPSYDGQLMSNNWLHDHYMVDKQHHQKGGVGRAIHYHYIFPPYVANCWEEIHGKNTWPRYTQTYACPHTGKNKRHNVGSLTKEQHDFLVAERTSIRKKIRDYIWNVFR